ncbi:hypothetical protein H0H87_005134 [Tephrocybe sp. NHM501043]|nr:hypothetical protein H0H87_005134 [Tephrocybe sp. NHM501043]
MSVSWASDINKEEEMSLTEAITLSSETLIAKVLCPNWLLKLPVKSLQKVESAWSSMGNYVNSHIQFISQEINQQGIDDVFELRHADLLHRLVASSEGDGKNKLSDKEVVRLLLTAKTTANSIIATLGYLAIHQDDQEKAYADVKNRIGSNGQLDPFDPSDLPYLQACFQEAVRLFSSSLIVGHTLPKDFPIKSHHYGYVRNPHVFADPEQYKPLRWLGIPETDVTMFGTGPRACIGRKLAYTEAISLLALFLRDWNLDVELAPGETRSQYQERIMVTGPYAGTVSPIGLIPLKITRRPGV